MPIVYWKGLKDSELVTPFLKNYLSIRQIFWGADKPQFRKTRWFCLAYQRVCKFLQMQRNGKLVNGQDLIKELIPGIVQIPRRLEMRFTQNLPSIYPLSPYLTTPRESFMHEYSCSDLDSWAHAHAFKGLRNWVLCSLPLVIFFSNSLFLSTLIKIFHDNFLVFLCQHLSSVFHYYDLTHQINNFQIVSQVSSIRNSPLL